MMRRGCPRSPPQTLSTGATSYNAQLGATHYGGASQLHAVWLQEDLTPDGFSVYHVMYAEGQAAGNWTGPTELHQDSAYLEMTGAAAVGSAPMVGVAYLPWACDENGNNCAPLNYRACNLAAANGDCANDAQWSAPEQVAQDTNAPALAFDADGNAHLAWRSFADTGYAIAYAAKLQSGGWTGAANVLFGQGGGDMPGSPLVGAGSANNVYVGLDDWTQTPPLLQLSHYDGGGWTTALQSNDAASYTERWGSVIVDDAGVGQFVWSGANGQVYYAELGTANPTPTATATATSTPTATPTPTQPLISLAVTDASGNAMSTLDIQNGWYKPNPLTIKIIVTNPQSTELTTVIPFQFGSSSNTTRFYIVSGAAGCSGTKGSYNGEPYSYISYEGECTWTFQANETYAFTWNVWIQPSNAGQLELRASNVMLGQAQKTISHPTAQIHPIIFLPGLGATLPPRYGGDPHLDNGPANILGQYNNLFWALEKMGFEWEKTYFEFPYDWFTSNLTSAEHLKTRIDDAKGKASAVAWVSGSDGTVPIKVDLIGHSTGTLVARTYIESAASLYGNDVRKFVSIGGPQKGLPAPYYPLEGVQPQGLDPIQMIALNDVAPTRAKAHGYDVTCIYYAQNNCWWAWKDDNEKYQYAHDPVNGPTILPEFLAAYNDIIASLQDSQGNPLPFGRMANPLLEDSSVVAHEQGNGLSEQMAGKAFDAYTGNPKVTSDPIGWETQYFGLNAPARMQLLDERLNPVQENVCMIFGDGLDTTRSYEVTDPSISQAPYWFNGKYVQDLPKDKDPDHKGDGYVPSISANPEGIWYNGHTPSSIAIPNKEHATLAGQEETIRATIRCLMGNDMAGSLAAEMLPSAAEQVPMPVTGMMYIVAFSPVELTLTDPNGHRLGYQPGAPNDTIQELELGSYARDTTNDDKYLTLFNPTPGNYTLTVTGTGNGEYQLMGTFGDSQAAVSLFGRVGNTVQGQVDTLSFDLPSAASQVPNPPLIEAGDDITGTVGAVLTLHGGFTDPNPNDTHEIGWDFGDGSTLADTLTPTHSYSAAGDFTVTLTITDTAGFVVSDTLRANIIALPTPTPTDTPTSTPTNTPTESPIPTETLASTATFTPTSIPTSTVTQTVTPTDAPTVTATYTPTPTPIPSSTPSVTNTPTAVSAKAKVKGEGKIPSTVSGKKASFKVEAKRKKVGGPLKGEIEYEDKAAGIKFKSTTLEDLVVTENRAVIQGTGILNKTTTVQFTVTLQDNGEPGRDTDTFAISFSNGYGNDGTLTEGNIQVREDERDE
ncbi:MAG: PKD domain-containing protein [Chloroflexi bacterium]|nr:PKD domain-containing protein [Chloroflexota bacterium]